MADLRLEELERWREHGAGWRVVHQSEGLAVVDLLTCYGEPVERRRSELPEVIAFLAEHPSHEAPEDG